LAEGAGCLAREQWPCAVASARQVGALGLAAEGRALHEKIVAALQARAETLADRAEGAAALEARVAAQETALAAWFDYHAVVPGPDTPRLVALRARHEKDAARLSRQQEAGRARAAAEEKRRLATEERAARRREAEEERAARRREAEERREAWSSRGLRCCDGTLSPSCSCGGSHQGCCSHHRGVCGCE
jgi:hypothetical protein